MTGSKPKASDLVGVEYLRECFEYRAGILYWKTRPASHFARPQDHATFIAKSAGKAAGRLAGDGYYDIKIRIGGKPVCFGVHRIVWAIHHGRWPELHIDHINRNPSDNRIENLREVTPAENHKNSARLRVHPYVCPNTEAQDGRFAAWTNIGGQKAVYLGIFDSEAQAIAHRNMVNDELEKLARSLAKKSKIGRPRKDRIVEVAA